MRGSIYTDGACKGNPGPSSIGVVVKDEYGNTVDTHASLIGHGTSNIAEYCALKKGLEMAHARGINDLDCFTDSELLMHHVNNKKNVQSPPLVAHMRDIKDLLNKFDTVKVSHIRRHFNTEADSVANDAFRRNKAYEQVEDALA